MNLDHEIDYNTPTLYNNCANPITLAYVNSNIKENYESYGSNYIIYHKKDQVTINNFKQTFGYE